MLSNDRSQTSRQGGSRRHGSRRPANGISAEPDRLPVALQPQPGGPEGGRVRHHDAAGHHQRGADVSTGLPVERSRSEEKAREEEGRESYSLSLTHSLTHSWMGFQDADITVQVTGMGVTRVVYEPGSFQAEVM